MLFSFNTSPALKHLQTRKHEKSMTQSIFHPLNKFMYHTLRSFSFVQFLPT